MALTRHPKYPDIWIARIYTHGRKKDPKTGKATNRRESYTFEGTEAEARAWYMDLVRTPTTGAAAPLAPTMDQAWPQFCATYKNRVSTSTYHDVLMTWAHRLSPFFGQLRPHQLTPGLIETYKSKRLTELYLPGKPAQKPGLDTPEEREKRKPPTPRTINKELSQLSALITWMSQPEINLAKPLHFSIKGFPKKQTEAPTPIIPTRKEIVMLLRRSERQYRPIFAFCYYTGARRSEALLLTGAAINWSQGYVVIKGKGNKQRIVPIFRKLRVYLRKRRKTAGYIWPNPETGKPYTDVKKALRRAADRAGIDQRIYLHLLRHSFGTHSIQSGVNLRSLQLLMGHSSSKVTETYTTLASQFLATEMDKFGSGSLRQKKTAKKTT